jgi:hypothetical protein
MLYQRIEPATVHCFDHKGLRAAWGLYGPGPIVGTYTVRKPLTASQLRRLPSELRRRLK